MQLLCVGTITPRKGYDILVEALEPLKDLDWRLTIAGPDDRDTEMTSALRAQINAAGLHDRITLSGVVVPATLDRFYESADVFVMPSLYEATEWSSGSHGPRIANHLHHWRRGRRNRT